MMPSFSLRMRNTNKRLHVPVRMATKNDVGSDSLDRDSPRTSTPDLSTRAVALSALAESYQKRGKIALRSLEGSTSYQLLDSRDRAFARLLLTTTERRQGQIDQIVDSFIRKAKSRKVSVQLSPVSAITLQSLLKRQSLAQQKHSDCQTSFATQPFELVQPSFSSWTRLPMPPCRKL